MALEVRIKKKLNRFLLDVAFEAGDGVFSLLGASGCGKSMTLKCIAGIEKPDEGRIVLDGRVLYDSEREIDLPPRKRRVGYMFQDYALFPNMTVLQNVMAGMKKPENGRPDGDGGNGRPKRLFLRKDRRRSEAAALEKAEDILRRFHIYELRDLYPAKLSGGQKQRVAMARLIAQEADVLLLDEPFSALDSHLKWQLEQEMKQTLEGIGRPVVFVSHDRDEVYHLAHRICCISSGRSQKTMPVKAFFENPGTAEGAVLSGCKNVAAASPEGSHALRVREWGITLNVRREIGAEISAAGIRAHAFSRVRRASDDNVIPVLDPFVLEDPFEWTISFRAAEGGGTLQWKVPKAVMKDAEIPPELYLDSDAVMLLSRS